MPVSWVIYGESVQHLNMLLAAGAQGKKRPICVWGKVNVFFPPPWTCSFFRLLTHLPFCSWQFCAFHTVIFLHRDDFFVVGWWWWATTQLLLNACHHSKINASEIVTDDCVEGCLFLPPMWEVWPPEFWGWEEQRDQTQLSPPPSPPTATRQNPPTHQLLSWLNLIAQHYKHSS